MRKKIIRAFLGVYLAVCVTYGVVRGVTAPAMAEDVEPMEEPLPQTAAEIVPEETAQVEELIETAPAGPASGEFYRSGRSGRGRGRRGSSEMGAGAEARTAPAVSSVPAAQEEPEEDAEEETGEKEQSDDAAEPAAIPTLEEYLKNLHCGGCGRNCFLLNPHCMRGARKESRAESAYYEQYGYADGV